MGAILKRTLKTMIACLETLDSRVAALERAKPGKRSLEDAAKTRVFCRTLLDLVESLPEK